MEDKKYCYKILREQNLIIKYYSGTLSLEDLYDFTKNTGEDTDYLPTQLVINDLRDCSITIKTAAILDFINKIKENQGLYAKRKIVFLTDTPNQVLFSSMLDLYKKETFIDLNIVSTVEWALRCLMIPESDYEVICSTLEELKAVGREQGAWRPQC